MTQPQNAAKAQSEKTLGELKAHLGARISFILEAGAGSGKTYSLVECLKHLTTLWGSHYLRGGLRIACITYTNVATQEIRRRTDSHPAIFASTIHSFCWECCKPFQNELRTILITFERWTERLKDITDFKSRTVVYDLGYPSAKEGETYVALGHDDVLGLFAKLLERKKFRDLLVGRFPVIFVDEYQDTHKEVIEAIVRCVLPEPNRPILGFFGDGWQKIYTRLRYGGQCASDGRAAPLKFQIFARNRRHT